MYKTNGLYYDKFGPNLTSVKVSTETTSSLHLPQVVYDYPVCRTIGLPQVSASNYSWNMTFFVRIQKQN